MSLRPASELYDNETREAFIFPYKGVNLDPTLEVLDTLAAGAETDLIAPMDELRETDFDRYHDCRKVLGHLSARTLVENYGAETLFMARIETHFEDEAERFDQGLLDYTDFDPRLVEKARLWAWTHQRFQKTAETLTNYRVMDYVLNGGLEDIDAGEHVQKTAKPGLPLSDKRIANYSLLPMQAKGTYEYGPEISWNGRREQEPGVYYDVYMDTPYGFALAYKGKPQAVVGLSAGSDELMIHQLQGIRPWKYDRAQPMPDTTKDMTRAGARGLYPLDWQATMVSVTNELAREFLIPSVGIRAGEKNEWYRTIQHGETEPHLTYDAAVKAYDEPAKRLGFTQGEDGDWHQPVF